jgi:hypothetical protein
LSKLSHLQAQGSIEGRFGNGVKNLKRSEGRPVKVIGPATLNVRKLIKKLTKLIKIA